MTTATSTTTRPRLALLLAILSVPGSTLAWDLPHGGYWIGVPLAIAAILVARRAGRSGMTIAATVIAGLMLALTTAWTLAELLA
jgi:hypothetical protein